MIKKIPSIRQSLRVILAITAKDILAALKNKIILANLIAVLFIIVAYKFLLSLTMNRVPFIFLYDTNHSTYTADLENSSALHVHRYDSFAEFKEDFRTHMTDASIGLVLPVGFDQALASGEPPVITGYIMHWVNRKQIDRQLVEVERRLAAILGTPVRIDLDGGTLTMHPQSAGGFLASAAIVIAIFFSGISLIPHLMLEEKAARTLDALLVSPAKNCQIVIAKALAGLFYCLVLIMVIILLNSTLIIQWNLALLTVVLTTLISVMLGMILGTLLDHPQQVRLVTGMLMIPLFLPVFLSFMVGLIPSWLIDIMRWLPPVAASELMRFSFTEQVDLSLSLPQLGILLVSFFILLFYEIWLVHRIDH
jgi:hypothetical protein